MAEIRSNNEKELLLRIAKGDEAAFAEVMLHYSGLIHSFIYKHLNSRQDLVEELVSDVFLHIWLTRETLGEIRNLNSYLFVLCRNQAFNALKKELREKKRNHNWYYDQEDSTTDADEDISDLGISLIEQAIEQLAPQQKKVWIASRREGQTYEQIAGNLGISRETVKNHLQAATLSIKRFVLERMDMFTCLLIFQHIFNGTLPPFLIGVVHISN